MSFTFNSTRHALAALRRIGTIRGPLAGQWLIPPRAWNADTPECYLYNRDRLSLAGYIYLRDHHWYTFNESDL